MSGDKFHDPANDEAFFAWANKHNLTNGGVWHPVFAFRTLTDWLTPEEVDAKIDAALQAKEGQSNESR